MSISKLYSLIACRIELAKSNSNAAIRDRDADDINKLVREFMPSGSGFDAATKLDLDKSSRLKLTFYTSFHHMDEHGSYSHWTNHTVVITPNFTDFDIRVTGRDSNGIKDYIAEAFQHALSQDISHVWDNDALAFVFERMR